MKKNVLIFFVLLFFGIGNRVEAQNKNVLFIGNSYTDVNNLPFMVSEVSSSMGKTINYDVHTAGGAQFSTHWNNINTSGLLEKLQKGNLDFVVLQGQSQEVAFPDVQFMTDVYPYALKLDSLAKAYNPQCKVVFYMTWGYRYGDAVNCPYYPPFCTFLSMSQRLYDNYLKMATDFGSWVAPVGAAWIKSIVTDSTIVLHSSDNSHPSIQGTYLNSCIFYSTFFQDSINTQYLPVGVSNAECYFLQNISNSIMFDSSANWFQSYITTPRGRNFEANVYYSKETQSISVGINNIFDDIEILVLDVKALVIKRINTKPIGGIVKLDININNFIDGLYVVRIMSKGDSYNSKIVKY